MKNLLFIMTDQMRTDALGVNSSWVKTPNLDKIAHGGAVFDSCYTNSPLCVPARFALATGEPPCYSGIDNNISVDLAPSESLWTRQIKDLGYKTAVFGKTHLHRHEGDIRDRADLIKGYGFDVVDEIGGPRACLKVSSNMTDLWQSQGLLDLYREDISERVKNNPLCVRPSVLPLELYADSYVGNAANEYLKSVENDRPWFCWVSFGGPHEPWDTPEPYASMYDGVEMPDPIASQHWKSKVIGKNSVHGRRFASSPKFVPADVIAARRNYAGNVTLIDHYIGRVIDTLESRGELENTVIVFTSDHGEMNGDHGLIYKGVFFDAAVKVPLMISTPKTRSKGGLSRAKALVQLSDLGPTVLELLNGNKSSNGYSKSFASCVDNPRRKHRKFIFSELAGETMVANDDWKVIYDKNSIPYLVFNTKYDHHELHNLVDNKRSYLARAVARRALNKYTMVNARE